MPRLTSSCGVNESTTVLRSPISGVLNNVIPTYTKNVMATVTQTLPTKPPVEGTRHDPEGGGYCERVCLRVHVVLLHLRDERVWMNNGGACLVARAHMHTWCRIIVFVVSGHVHRKSVQRGEQQSCTTHAACLCVSGHMNCRCVTRQRAQRALPHRYSDGPICVRGSVARELGKGVGEKSP